MNIDIEVPKLIRAVENLGHSVFKNDTKPYNLNIVGIRADNPEVNKFNCIKTVFWKYEGSWNKFQTQMTSLAGSNYLKDPMNSKGCAILVPDQYRGCYKLDLHRGKYLALCQRKPVSVYRDNNENLSYDMVESTIENGLFGINCHRASAYKELDSVGKNSAGCQVTQDPLEYDLLIYLYQKAQEQWGEWFTYTLIKESDYNNA